MIDECLDYFPETGEFKWKNRPREHFATERGWKTFNSQRAGVSAGTLNSEGYLQVMINKQLVLLHRAAFAIMGKCIEGLHVDHIDHNRLNNSWKNLRAVTQAENNRNISRRVNSNSKIVGIYFNEKEGLWYPRIQVDYENIYLGATKDFFEAFCRCKSAELKYGFHENHGGN